MLNLDRIDAIIFDLDGTLMALQGGEKGGVVAKWLMPLARFLPGRDAEAFARRLFVVTETPTNYGLAILDRIGLHTWLRPLADWARRQKGIHTLETLSPIDGVAALVPQLADTYPLGVLTNRGRPEAYGFLEVTGLKPYFGAVTTRQDIWRFKPHPQAIRRTANLLNIPSERTLMVGDMPVDMQTAYRAGAQGVGVLTGFATEAELTAAGATVVIPSVLELPDLLV